MTMRAASSSNEGGLVNVHVKRISKGLKPWVMSWSSLLPPILTWSCAATWEKNLWKACVTLLLLEDASDQENHFVIQAFPGLQAISQGTSGTLGCPVMPCDALQYSWYSMAYCILLIFTTTLITHILFPPQGVFPVIYGVTYDFYYLKPNYKW